MTKIYWIFILISFLIVEGKTWKDGFFDDPGIWVPCLDICQTCTNITSWESCPDSLFLNTTSNLCEQCVDGKYFNPTSQSWLSCDGSCHGRCVYQSFCFDWPDGKFFDLEKMGWVSNWGTDSIQILDEQLWSKPLWRGFNYYVDPSSTEILELGTKAFPFKNIGLPFVEILNYHSHSNSTISVFIKENTEHNMLYNSNYVINITQVTVESYSDLEFVTPDYANIIMKNSGVIKLSTKTIFNIIKHTTLRFDNITNSGEISIQEENNSKNIH